MPTQLKFSQVKPFIFADLEANQTPALMGKPGIGKSSLIEDLAREFKTQVFVLPVNQLGDRADLTGVRATQDQKTGNWSQTSFPHATIMDAIQYALDHPDEHPILFMDEFNRATPDITSAILSFQTLRRIGQVSFPDNLRMIVAGNDKGNVTSLDEATVSRFAMYYVRPDLETFMSIQTLNPYVQAVLTKHPEDLTAEQIVRNATDTPDADADKEEGEDLTDFSAFLGEDSFKQITVPRTITYISNWLNTMGLNKSGSDKEKELLTLLFADMGDDDSNSLLAAIDAHVGQTTFADHLFDAIHSQFNNMLSSTQTSSQPLLANLRPKQDIINRLHHTNSVQDVETLISTMSEKERMSTLVWLTEMASTKEINNNQAVKSFMTNAPHQINAIDGESMQNLMKIMTHTDRISEPAVKALIETSAPSMDTVRGTIKLMTGLN